MRGERERVHRHPPAAGPDPAPVAPRFQQARHVGDRLDPLLHLDEQPGLVPLDRVFRAAQHRISCPSTSIFMNVTSARPSPSTVTSGTVIDVPWMSRRCSEETPRAAPPAGGSHSSASPQWSDAAAATTSPRAAASGAAPGAVASARSPPRGGRSPAASPVPRRRRPCPAPPSRRWRTPARTASAARATARRSSGRTGVIVKHGTPSSPAPSSSETSAAPCKVIPRPSRLHLAARLRSGMPIRAAAGRVAPFLRGTSLDRSATVRVEAACPRRPRPGWSARP